MSAKRVTTSKAATLIGVHRTQVSRVAKREGVGTPEEMTTVNGSVREIVTVPLSWVRAWRRRIDLARKRAAAAS